VEIRYCTFEHNSLHGLVVKNSDVTVFNSGFQRGHVCAVFLQEGANVNADSLSLKNNITGIACGNKSHIKIEKGNIRGNNYGIAVREGASVSIIDADVTSNKNGLVSEKEIGKKMREMVYKNTLDMKIVTPEEMEKILKPPQDVKSIVLPKTQVEAQVGSNFKPGFSALKTPREQTASFIGNVSLGFKYFAPTSQKHPKDVVYDTIFVAAGTDSADTVLVPKTPVYPQNKYIGEHGAIVNSDTVLHSGDFYYSDTNLLADSDLEKWYDGFQPEMVFFAQGKRGALDVNVNGDFEFNNWYDHSFKANLATLSMNYADQRVTIGDFYENMSDISLSGRKFRGIKYSGDFLPMGRGTKRVEFRLAAGETERSKDLGEHDQDQINYSIDSSAVMRQQFTYEAFVGVKPVYNATIYASGLIARDQDNIPALRDPNDFYYYNPVAAQTGVLGTSISLLDGKLDLNAELALGVSDTVKADTLRDSTGAVLEIDEGELENIAWYKPMITKAVPRVFGLFNTFTDNCAVTLNAEGIVHEFDITGSFTYISEEYFSAGNPYLEPDRIIAEAGAEKQFSDKLSASCGYSFERTSLSYQLDTDGETPLNNNTVTLAGEYFFGEGKPAVNADYEMVIRNNTDKGRDTAENTENNEIPFEYLEIDHNLNIGMKHQLENGIDYGLDYILKRYDDRSDYKGVYIQDKDDIWENGLRARLNFQIKQRIRNKLSVQAKYKSEVEDNQTTVDVKASENIRINLIPRKLALSLKADYRYQLEELDDEVNPGQRTDSKLTQLTLEGELKYTITSKLSLTGMCTYEDYYDEKTGSTENYSVIIGGLNMTYLF
jgi:hypothetical protein